MRACAVESIPMDLISMVSTALIICYICTIILYMNPHIIYSVRGSDLNCYKISTSTKYSEYYTFDIIIQSTSLLEVYPIDLEGIRGILTYF